MFIDDENYPTNDATVANRSLESFGYLDVCIERLAILGVSKAEIIDAVNDQYQKTLLELAVSQ